MAKALEGDWKVAGREKPKPYTFWGGGAEEGRAFSRALAATVKGDGRAPGFLLRQQVCNSSTGSVGQSKATVAAGAVYSSRG